MTNLKRGFFAKMPNTLGRDAAGVVKRFFGRFLFAVVIYASVVGVLSSFHDYPQFLEQLHKFRTGQEAAVKRPWLNMFYFINEAGSGIKFFFTNNEKHMRYYPSFGHLFASRLARAGNGDWHAQFLVGRMYFLGEGTEVNRREGLSWLRLAHSGAPEQNRAELAAILANAEENLAEYTLNGGESEENK